MIVLRNIIPSPYVQVTGEYADTSALMPVSAGLQPTGPNIPVTMARRFAALDEPPKSDEVRDRHSVSVIAPGGFDGKGRHSTEVPLSPKMMTGVASDGLYLGTSDSSEIRFLDPTGRELKRFRIGEETQPVDSATAARLHVAPKEDLGFSFSIADMYRDVKIPERTPRYRQLRADHAGRLWVQRFALDERAAEAWVVYTRDGRRVGAVTLPAGSRLLDAADSELLVVRKGILGSELLQVVPYRIR